MQIAWKKVAVAGVVGFCGGKAAGKLRRHPEVVLPILQLSAASAVVGGLLGWGVAVQKKVPPCTLSLSLSANCALVSSSFLGMRKFIHSSLAEQSSDDHHQTHASPNLWSPAIISYVSSLTSGGTTGAIISLITGSGLRSVLMMSLGGMGMGLCAQAGYDRVERWRRRKAIQIYYEDMSGEKTRMFDNWTLENFEARFLGFWHRRAESIAVEMEMLSVESAVAEERRRLERLDQQLAKRGVDPTSEENSHAATDGHSGGDDVCVSKSVVSL